MEGRRIRGSPLKEGNGKTTKDSNGGRKTPFIIGVGGGSASGKSTVCEKVRDGSFKNFIHKSNFSKVVK